LLLLLSAQTEQFGVGMLLTSGYPLNTGQAVSFSQTLNVTGPFEYVQHRILTVQPNPTQNQPTTQPPVSILVKPNQPNPNQTNRDQRSCVPVLCAMVDEDHDMIDWLQWRWSKSIDRHTAWSTHSVSDWRSIAPGWQ